MSKKKDEATSENVQKDPAANSAPPDTGSRLNKFMASALAQKILKEQGPMSLVRATEDVVKVGPRFSSGIFPVDFALGGGWPTGLIHTVFGPQSSGKTTLVLRAIAEYQKVCALCCTGDYKTRTCSCGSFRETTAAFVDTEGTWDEKWARDSIGVDLNRLLVSRPEYGEQAIDIMDALLRTGDFDVLAIDSLAFLVPMKEIEESVEKDMMGVQARLIGRFVRKLVSGLLALENAKKRRPTIFFTNQTRMKLGVMFGNPETTPGGNAPRFASAIELRTSAGEYHIPTEKEGGTGLGKPTSVQMRYKVVKNKTFTSRIEGEYTMMLTEVENKKLGDVMDEQDIVSMAEKVGALEGSGSSYTLFEEKYKGKTALEAKLMYDKPFRTEICNKLMPLLLGSN